MKSADKPSPATTKPAASPMPATPASRDVPLKPLDMQGYVEHMKETLRRRHPPESNPPK